MELRLWELMDRAKAFCEVLPKLPSNQTLVLNEAGTKFPHGNGGVITPEVFKNRGEFLIWFNGSGSIWMKAGLGDLECLFQA